MTSLNPNLAAAPVRGVTVVDPAQSFLSSSANSSGGMEKVSRPWINVIVFRPARVFGVRRIGERVPFLEVLAFPFINTSRREREY
jgi:hypothetical protein